MRTLKLLYRLEFPIFLCKGLSQICIFVQIPKGSKLLVWSALPSTVKWAKAHICASPYSCKKIGRGIPARFLRFTNFHRCFYLCKYPQTPSALGSSGVCLGSPFKSQHGANLAVYGGHSLGLSTGDITLPSSFSKQHSV